ncbi:uncharacterized protein L201_001855 [Kwoniella dendrophila CBS 6074]|uniref:Uncharacterized protein n=1 Tax=Kwoniella dendrophila CBS 6074 TaxID=1295534 RepID=A0AAX4JQ07_9TREE
MPAPNLLYITPPPSRRSSINIVPQPQINNFFRRHSLPERPLNARTRLDPLSPIDDDSGDDAEGEDDENRSAGRADKRRRVTKGGKAIDVIPSPRKDHGGGSRSPSNHDIQSNSHATRNGRGTGSTLAPIKPIGFAAAREARRDDNDNQALPSPVVMGFDFKAIDQDQLKTVRDTISIKEQQQALIAARRREVAQSQPSTPKELTFKGWAPKDNNGHPPPLPPSNSDHSISTPRESFSGPSSAGAPVSGGGVGRRREKTRDKVEKMSIVTSATERDVVPGSKSAPLNQGLASQQASPREPPSGSQTSVPPHILPPIHGYGHHPGNGMTDPRTAPIRSRNGEEHEFARQQGPYYGLPQTRPLARPYESQQNLRGPATISNDRRNFSVPSNNAANLHLPSSSSAARYEGVPSPRRSSINVQQQQQQPQSNSPKSYTSGSGSSPRILSRENFLLPFNQLYDLLYQTDNLRYNLQDLMNRNESAYQQQINQIKEFKSTAQASNTLLNNLQSSADSLKELVRYEVERNNQVKDRELDELKERLRRLEEKDSNNTNKDDEGEGEKRD